MPGIPIENIETIWPMVSHYLDKQDADYGKEDFKGKCLRGDYILWVGRNGKVAVILEVSDYHKGKECDIVVLAGEGINDWINELSEIEEWAKRSGCNRMILTGRQGWVKVLKDYKVKTLTMVKRL